MRPVPINLFLRVIAVTIDGEIILSGMREVALVVDAEVGDAGVVGDGRRVWCSHADRENGVLDNVQVLEGCRYAVL